MLKRLRILYLSCLLIALQFSNSYAQGMDDLLKAGTHDAELLVSQYMEPMVVGLGVGMSSGWYNTAKPHKTLGFDLTLSVHAVLIPSSKSYFTFVSDKYENTDLAPGASNQIPTIFGPGSESSTSELTYTVEDENSGNTVSGSFSTPTGIGMEDYVGFNMVPAPILQASVGIIKNTEIMLRYVPEIEIDNYAFDQVGFGIKHDIFQWVPVLSRLPLDASVLFAYNKMNNSYDISSAGYDGENQKSTFDVTSWTTQVLVSKKLSILTLYAGVGYASVKSDMDVKGTYEIEDDSNPDVSVTVEDPVSITYKTSGVSGTLGFRFKFGVFTWHTDYTVQEYSVVSTGFGLSFR